MLNYNEKNLNILQKLQNRGMRAILGVNKYTNVNKMLDSKLVFDKAKIFHNTCVLVYLCTSI